MEPANENRDCNAPSDGLEEFGLDEWDSDTEAPGLKRRAARWVEGLLYVKPGLTRSSPFLSQGWRVGSEPCSDVMVGPACCSCGAYRMAAASGLKHLAVR